MARWCAKFAPAIGAVVGVLIVSLLVLRTTQATFSNTTSTPSNTWNTGGVIVTDDSSSSAIFAPANDGTLTGGQIVPHCITVTFHGTTISGVHVRLYATASGALVSSLTVVIDQGTGGGAGSCSGFNPTTSGIYSGTVSGLAGSATDYTSGVGSWGPTSINAAMTYRFTVTVPNTVAAQNATGTAVFTWESQS